MDKIVDWFIGGTLGFLTFTFLGLFSYFSYTKVFNIEANLCKFKRLSSSKF